MAFSVTVNVWDFLQIKFLFGVFGRALQSDAQPLIRWQRMATNELTMTSDLLHFRKTVEKYSWKYILEIKCKVQNGKKLADNDQCFSTLEKKSSKIHLRNKIEKYSWKYILEKEQNLIRWQQMATNEPTMTSTFLTHHCHVTHQLKLNLSLDRWLHDEDANWMITQCDTACCW